MCHSVAQCVVQTEQLREQPEIGCRGSSPAAINQFFYVFLLGPHVLALFTFGNIHYFMLLTSVDFILL